MKLASTTDEQAVVSAAVKGEEARVPQAHTGFEFESQGDGSNSVSYENPASERSLLMERLRQDAEEANQLIGSEEEVGRVDVLGEPRAEPESTPEPEAAQPAQESVPVAQPSGAAQFHQRIGQLTTVNPEGVRALASTQLQVPGAVLNLLASEAGGADLAIHLAEHPEVAAELNKMPIERAVKETAEALVILKYEAQRASGQQAPARRAVSQAPTPIKPLGGGNTKSSVPLDSLSYQDFRRVRDQQQKNRYTR
jgi:hypothetical protein